MISFAQKQNFFSYPFIYQIFQIFQKKISENKILQDSPKFS